MLLQYTNIVTYLDSGQRALDQGVGLASKLPSGCRPDNALSRLGSPPGGWISGRRCLHSIVKCIPTVYFEFVLETITIL